jgi:hypothetical protein
MRRAWLASQFIFIDILLALDQVNAIGIASSSITFVPFENCHLKTIYANFEVGCDVQYDEVVEVSKRI